MSSAGLETVLQQLTGWPVGPAGVLATWGDTAHRFPLASVTKPLATLAMLVAVEEGALELSTPANAELLPGATLAHLLSHASGLAPQKMLRSFAPATRRVYSNIGIELAGELVAAAVEMPFADYAQQALLTPLGLTDTSLTGSPAKDGVSTVADVARVVAELLNPTSLLHPSTLAAATSIQYPGLRGVLPGYGGQDPNDWGLGFEIRSHKQPHWTGSANSPATYGHFGQSGTMFWIDPAAGIGLVALADEPFGPWAADAWPRLADAVLTSLR
jgi:CubicO group peptidase (beta-lactamase class C family)